MTVIYEPTASAPKQVKSRTRPLLNLAYALPQRLRWKLFREFGGHPKKWVQWIYDAEGDYSLRPMRQLNCVFVHIPKAAGISVNRALFGHNGAGHASVGDYLSVFGSAWYDRAFKFTFVRHPVSRLVSAYDFLRRGGFHDGDRRFAESYLSRYETLDDFVTYALDEDAIRHWPHFKEQASFLVDPRSGETNIDFIGRVEFMERDFRRVCDRLGVSRPLRRENAREASDRDPSLDLSPKSIAKIRQVYARDFTLFGYN